MNLFGYHLRGIADFAGRERRKPFWLWILIVYLAQMAIGIVVMVPLLANWFSTLQAQLGSDPQRINGHPEIMMQAMAPFMQQMMVYSVCAGLLHLLLILAATVRRLHDAGKSGWWAAPYFAVQLLTPVIGMAVIPRMFDHLSPTPGGVAFQAVDTTMRLFSLVQAVGLLLLLMMIVLLTMPSSVGENRFGAEPPAS